ncbi:hypothetical protein ABGB18_45480 [Nonomuraea sp. B12E4]|uniref:hypothetical protein n=1 Tax=Nonomuraea sp. B12E4 TaxID=3153564 RepID=UPI00325CE776
MIEPAHRGKFLLDGWERALAKVRDMGCELIAIDVRDDGPHELWRRLGFQSYGLLPDYARVAGRSISGHYMCARLDEIIEHHERTGSWLFTDEQPAAH